MTTGDLTEKVEPAEKHEIGIFKKRKRPGTARSRKRQRTPAHEEEGERREVARVKLLQRRTKGPRQKSTKGWHREQFSANIEQLVANNATAERTDIGGEAGSSKLSNRPFGPMKAPAHLRTSVRVDYQPDVCKDYKETGYCGFGDSCKFLHDRSDYKAGWQLERDWAEQEKKKRDAFLRGEDPDAEEANKTKEEYDKDGLPFACFLCREEFKSPIMTLCEHYFCEECALSRMEKDPSCPICKKQLRDTLNPASKLIAKLQLKHKL
ncbi:Pre-mRNA-splicing factor CWC24-like protein [Gracilaria domingensis]|nr:Pre-mRNA-splicing factor CWC24-like protein [Gracilaria domingensis]